jgi:hypothetical protein
MEYSKGAEHMGFISAGLIIFVPAFLMMWIGEKFFLEGSK